MWGRTPRRRMSGAGCRAPFSFRGVGGSLGEGVRGSCRGVLKVGRLARARGVSRRRGGFGRSVPGGVHVDARCERLWEEGRQRPNG